MTFETAGEIFNRIEATAQKELQRDLVLTAVRYAQIRAEWYLVDTRKRGELSKTRTSAHNVFIDSCDILSRNMAEAGESISWRKLLGSDRAEIGDFACHIHCILGIRARQMILGVVLQR